MSNVLKISESEYCNEEEAAQIMELSPEQFRERLKWGRGPHPVGRDRKGHNVWVRKMVKSARDARALGKIV